MELYIILCLFYIFCIVLENFFRNRRRKINLTWWLIALIFPLYILAAFRAPCIGNDTFNYFNSYKMINQGNTKSYMEIGYIIIERLFKQMGANYLIFQIIVEAFIYISFVVFIKRYSKNYAWSVFIFLTFGIFGGTLNIQRQFLAIAILLWSFQFIQNRRILPFIFLTLAAISVHTSAIIFLILYPVVTIIWNKLSAWFFLVVSFIAYFVATPVINLFTQITGKYGGYLDSEYFIFSNNTAIYYTLAVSIVMVLTGIYSHYYLLENNQKDILKKSDRTYLQDNQILFSSMVIAALFGFVGLKTTIMGRLARYFDLVTIAYLPNAIENFRIVSNRKIVSILAIIFLFLYFVIILYYRPNWNRIYPYVFWWDYY